MKRRLKKYLYILTGVVIMADITGCSDMKFERYDSKDPLINITMDYPAGWQYNESRGSYNSYAHVLFLLYNKNEKGPKPAMSLTVREESKVDFTPRTIEAAANDIIARRRSFQSMQLLFKSERRLLGAEAVFIEMSYLSLENLRIANSKLILFKEKIIIFKRGKKFYFIKYENLADKYNEYAKAFDHVVKSVKFK